MSENATRTRGGRAGGRTPYQEAQRQKTREAILTAAGAVFAEKYYVFATIDDIIRAAGVSRATFYQHFQTKLELAMAIVDSIDEDWWPRLEGLARIDPDDIDNICTWIVELSELYTSHGYITLLYDQLNLFEEEFYVRLRATRDRLIDVLGETVPAFKAARAKSFEGRRARARVHLLLQRVNSVCSEISLHAPLADADIYVRLLAEEISAFLKTPDPRAK